MKTNMTPMEIISISNQALKTSDKKFDELEFPLEGHRTGHTINSEKGWVIEWEKEYNKNAIYKYIFDYTNYIKEYQ